MTKPALVLTVNVVFLAVIFQCRLDTNIEAICQNYPGVWL